MKRLAAALCALAFLTTAAMAQDWPVRAVRIIVPFGAGSTPDIVARLLAESLQAKLGQAFIVENKAGASGNTGTDAIAKAEPDGYTLGVSIGGPLAINTLLYARLPYDPEKDIAPITQLVTQPSILAVANDTGITSVAGLVKALKKEPEKYNYGSIGNGSVSHLSMEALAQKSGAQIVHVPYPGSPAAVTALIRNDVQIAVLPGISIYAQAETAPIKMLAVTTAERSKLVPDLPTLRESGIDVEADAWQGLIAPAKTPPAVVAKIHREVVEAMRAPGIREKLAAQLMEPVGSTPEELRAKIRAEVARWRPVIEAGKIKVN
ncbi:tripartite-type tricarboxylate transporter receptor subunit TctC [Variibacter gotjawalensis]|nr:tripartite-type tricarboxylate transporter receptor subunit TctC [Variibacter gotjawalensis]